MVKFPAFLNPSSIPGLDLILKLAQRMEDYTLNLYIYTFSLTNYTIISILPIPSFDHTPDNIIIFPGR